MRPTVLCALLALLVAATVPSAFAGAQAPSAHPTATAAQGAGDDQYQDPLGGGDSAGGGSDGGAGASGGAAGGGGGGAADSSGAGGGEPGSGPPLTDSMEGGGPAAAEPRLARTGSEPLIVALAGLGLLLCGAGLRIRLRAPE